MISGTNPKVYPFRVPLLLNPEGMKENSPAFRTCLACRLHPGGMFQLTLSYLFRIPAFWSAQALLAPWFGPRRRGPSGGKRRFPPEGGSHAAAHHSAGLATQVQPSKAGNPTNGSWSSPVGTTETRRIADVPGGASAVPAGLDRRGDRRVPALKGWAILSHPYGTDKAHAKQNTVHLRCPRIVAWASCPWFTGETPVPRCLSEQD